MSQPQEFHKNRMQQITEPWTQSLGGDGGSQFVSLLLEREVELNSELFGEEPYLQCPTP